jgi:hypothetical protein
MTPTPFRWPNQLGHAARNQKPKVTLGDRFVLVSKNKNAKTGRHKTASSSNGLIDIAAAVELGLVPNAGLPGILHHMYRKRVLRLLQHNTVLKVKPKNSTIQGNHQTKGLLKLADKALTAVIGPAYWSANQHLGPRAALKTTRVINWIKTNLENKTSPLCISLVRSPYEDIIGLHRSKRWWLDLFDLRKNVQSNLTP